MAGGQLETDPGSGTIKVSKAVLQERGYGGKSLPPNEIWLLECREETDRVKTESLFPEEEGKILEARQWLRRFFALPGLYLSRESFWDAIQTVALEILDFPISWVEEKGGEWNTDPYRILEEKGEEESKDVLLSLRKRAGEILDGSTEDPGLVFQKSRGKEWAAWIEVSLKEQGAEIKKYRFFMAGLGSPPSQALLHRLRLFIEEEWQVFIHLRSTKMFFLGGEEDLRAPLLKNLLFTVRNNLQALIKEKLGISGEDLTFNILFSRYYAHGFRYVFDVEQEKRLDEMIKEKNLTKEKIEKYIKAHTFGVENPQHRAVESMGLAYLVRKTRMSIYHPLWSNNIFPGLKYHKRAGEVEIEVFGRGRGLSWVLAIPVLGQHPLWGEGEVVFIVFVAGQPHWPVLTPELQGSLRRLVMESSADIVRALEIQELATRHGKHEFLRQVAWFLGHNLPKTTVTPLRILEGDLRKALPPDKQYLLSKMSAISSLLETMFSSLDVFRVPGKTKIRLEEVDLKEMVEKVKDYFQYQVEARAEASSRFKRLKDNVKLEVSFDPPENQFQGRIKAYYSGLFNALIVPIDNSLRSLEVDILEKDPSRGTVELLLKEKEDGIEIEIKDRGRGIPQKRLKKIQERLAYMAQGGIPLEERLAFHGGERLGLGLLLAQHFLNGLQGKGETRGRLEIDSREGRGTTVTLFLPKNPEQEEMDY